MAFLLFPHSTNNTYLLQSEIYISSGNTGTKSIDGKICIS